MRDADNFAKDAQLSLGGDALPTIAYFLGIAVRMFFNDHDPPHFHVRYQQYRARVRIEDGKVIDGRLPPTVTRLIMEWTALRREVLMKNWIAARNDGRLERIEGLE
jgi:uncharacterized protein DUF4160